MASKNNDSARSSAHSGENRLRLGTTYGGHDPVLLARMLPFVQYVEITPDTIAQIDGDTPSLHQSSVTDLTGIGGSAQVIVHGIGLSIGTHSGYSERYLRLLDMLLEQVDVAWHSEHLGYTIVNGENTGTMLALPKTDQVLDMLCERIRIIQERYPLPFLLENIIHMLPDYPGDYTDAAFLNALVTRTGCGLILDVYNLQCDAHNHQFDIPGFLNELDMSHVWEVHVACGTEYRGFLLDAHSKPTRDSTVELAREVIVRAGGAIKVVTYELLREAASALGHEAIVNELRRLRAALCN